MTAFELMPMYQVHQSHQRVESDEEGMLRTVETHGVKVRYIVGISTPKTTATAWRENAACVHCEEPVDASENAALVVTPNRDHRVAHRGECFVLACVATNPAVMTGGMLAARQRRINSPTPQQP